MKPLQSLIAVTLVVFLIRLTQIVYAFAGCADCVVDIVPMPGSEPPVNGRRGISVQIATSGHSPSTTNR